MMPEPNQNFAHFSADALLDIQSAWIIFVWFKTVGEVSSNKSRSVDGSLDVHFENHMIE